MRLATLILMLAVGAQGQVIEETEPTCWTTAGEIPCKLSGQEGWASQTCIGDANGTHCFPSKSYVATQQDWDLVVTATVFTIKDNKIEVPPESPGFIVEVGNRRYRVKNVDGEIRVEEVKP